MVVPTLASTLAAVIQTRREGACLISHKVYPELFLRKLTAQQIRHFVLHISKNKRIG